MAELKRCPFCGGEAQYGKETDEFGVSYHYVGCGCIEGCFASGSTEEEAIEAWNKRANPWHTGTPKEEGWYLVALSVYNEQRYTVGYYPNDVLFFPKNEHMILAWQKIEPYKED